MVWDNIIEQEKRIKIAKTGAMAIGMGIGAILLQFFFKAEEGDRIVRDAFSYLGITIMVYGFAVLGVFIFKPERVRFFYAVATYILVPIPVIMFVIDIVQALTKSSGSE